MGRLWTTISCFSYSVLEEPTCRRRRLAYCHGRQFKIHGIRQQQSYQQSESVCSAATPCCRANRLFRYQISSQYFWNCREHALTLFEAWVASIRAGPWQPFLCYPRETEHRNCCHLYEHFHIESWCKKLRARQRRDSKNYVSTCYCLYLCMLLYLLSCSGSSY